MGDKTREMFQELRSLLNGDQTHEAWIKIIRQFERLFPSTYDTDYTRWSDVEYPDEERVLEEILPYVRGELDARWPYELRVVRHSDHEVVQSLGKILSIAFGGDGMQSFGALFGKSYSTAISKKLIRELPPYWIRAKDHSFEGLVLTGVDKYHAYLLEQLLASGHFENLRYVRTPSISPTCSRKQREDDPSTLSEFTNRLINLRGDTLESFGGSFAGSSHMDALYRPILDRADELPELTWMYFNHNLYNEPDLFPEFMKDARFDGLDTLTFPDGLTAERATILINREASENLRRIGVGRFGYYTRRFDVRQIIDDDYLAGVQIWDVRDDERVDGEWESPQARTWRDYKNGVTRDLLGERVVDLRTLDARATKRALFSESGALRPAPEMRALRLRNISEADLDVIIDQGHEVWPQLECLVFQFCPLGSNTDLSFEWLQRVNQSPWLDQLKFLDWDTSIYHPYRVILNNHYSDKKANSQRQLEWLELILDGTWRPFLAYRCWKGIEDEIRTKPQAIALANRLGITDCKKVDRYEINRRIEAAIIDALGGREALKLNGPTHACHDWTEDFEW